MGSCGSKASGPPPGYPATSGSEAKPGKSGTSSGSATPKRPSSADKEDDPRRLVLTKDSWTSTAHHEGKLEDRYKVLTELGRGGFGAVNKVERLSDGATLACKTVNMAAVKEPEKALKEAELWEVLSSPFHDAVLTLVEVIKAPDGLFLVCELCPYGELFDALDNIVFSEQACRMVTVQVASALAHLHLRHQVAHCDVKPANILVRHSDPTQPGALKLADYGFAQRFESRSRPSFTVSCGTLDYFAPELAANFLNTRARTVSITLVVCSSKS